MIPIDLRVVSGAHLSYTVPVRGNQLKIGVLQDGQEERRGCPSEQGFDGGDRLVDLRGVLAPGGGHVRPAAA